MSITPEEQAKIDTLLKSSNYKPGGDWFEQTATTKPEPKPTDVSDGGFFASKPTGESPYQTESMFTSPILPYGEKSQGAVETVGKAAVNLPTSIIRLADTLVDPKTYTNLGRAAAGGIQSIPGVKDFFDNVASAKGKEMLQTNRDTFHNFVDTLENQYGSWENIKRSIAEDPAGTALVVRGLMETASGIAGKAGLEKTAGTLKGVGESVFPVEKVVDAFKNASDLKNRIQTHFGEKNVNPQLTASADRMEAPVQKYDKYVEQAQKGATDIKSDSALSTVGNEVGKAFNDVIEQRKGIGEFLGAELKKVGNEQVKIDTEPFFEKVRESSKSFTTSDLRLLNKYITGLDNLGDTPTVKQVDDFLRKIPQEVVEYKGTKGITGTTPAEGLIKQNLSELRNSFSSNKNLENYTALRKTYSDLTDFLDEGVRFLGKKTQSRDYARDASLTKSSVQSLLDNGKKDWLLKLEALTDYPALDNAVLALQAMKDVGDFRGTSLLQKIGEGAPPVTPRGITTKVFDWAAGKIGEKITGSPVEQTRAFLKSLTTSEGKLGTTPKEGVGIPTFSTQSLPKGKVLNKSSSP